MSSFGYVVESAARDEQGNHRGTFRVYVGSEDRAKQIAAAAPGRTFREVALEDMPPEARANLERARAEDAGA